MPVFGNIVLNDAAATPVAHTFAPGSLNGPLATYADRVSGISVGFPIVTSSLIIPNKASKAYKARFKIVWPILETISNSTFSGIAPAPTKAYDLTFDGTFLLPERSTLQNRKDIRKLAKELLDHATVIAMVEGLESVY